MILLSQNSELSVEGTEGERRTDVVSGSPKFYPCPDRKQPLFLHGY